MHFVRIQDVTNKAVILEVLRNAAELTLFAALDRARGKVELDFLLPSVSSFFGDLLRN